MNHHINSLHEFINIQDFVKMFDTLLGNTYNAKPHKIVAVNTKLIYWHLPRDVLECLFFF